MSDPTRLAGRYERIYEQIHDLVQKTDDPAARMATASAILHHKMPHFFWTGFYQLIDGDLIVGPYQGPVACLVLERDKGVCWACANRNESILVPDVHAFEGHIACDARSQSEVVVPVRAPDGSLRAVLDVDSDKPDAFQDADREGLERIASLIYA